MKHTYRVTLEIECDQELDHKEILDLIDNVSLWEETGKQTSILVTNVEDTTA